MNPQKPMTTFATSMLGIGSMIGAGIFALMGEAGNIAGSASWIAFLIAGAVAMLSGWSMARLGARYPAAGGIVEYLTQGFGPGLLAGSLSILLYISAMVALAMVAKTFGSYAAALLSTEGSSRWVNGLADLVVITFVMINLEGARQVARSEGIIVVTKVVILVAFALAGLWFSRPELLSPRHYPPAQQILFSLAITFFAYEGFRVITNTAEDMPNPAKTLPRAMALAISLVTLLYLLVAFAVFGNLDVPAIIQARDYALAEAARPAFGQAGFTIVAIAALISTASSINANLYAVTNVTYQLARDGELPAAFGKPLGRSREGLLISALLIMLGIHFLRLSEIAAVGSITVLIVHLMVHIGHVRLRRETGASLGMILLAIAATLLTIGFAVFYLAEDSPHIIWLVGVALTAALVAEALLQKLRGRVILPRTPEPGRQAH